jgi:hypothetical protein
MSPEVTIAVVIDEPKTGGRGGGAVAAPVFKKIAEQILPDMGIRPDNGGFMPEQFAAEEVPESIGNGEELNGFEEIIGADTDADGKAAALKSSDVREEKAKGTSAKKENSLNISKTQSRRAESGGAIRSVPAPEVTRKRIETENRN